MRIALILIVAVFTCISAARGDVIGRASVIDGDTIEIHGERIRLEGIDAPESRQLCTVEGEPYRCGQQAALALADYIGQRTVRCEERTRDRYGRTVATCYVDEEDIDGWMMAQGWALALRKYSTRYVSEEDAASSGRARDLARHVRSVVGLAPPPAGSPVQQHHADAQREAKDGAGQPQRREDVENVDEVLHAAKDRSAGVSGGLKVGRQRALLS